LLDTHTFLWAIDKPQELTGGARSAITNTANNVLVSAVVVWEVEIKRALGKITAPADLCAAAANSAFELLAITARHGIAAAQLPRVHADPFDRMLVAQAMLEDCVLVTRDRKLQRYSVATLTA
jgi:PIN domain nuclease of toxin-antitoxin system